MTRSRASRRLFALVAGLPILVAAGFLIGQTFSGSPDSAPRALAEAGPGTFAVVIRNEGVEDTVLAVDASSGDAVEIAKLGHLDGYASFASVSPAGDRLAAVVADRGMPAHPVATLHVVDLHTGATRQLESNLDQLQQPIWDPSGEAVFVTRSAATGLPATDVTILRVEIATGAVSVAMSLSGVAGAYPVGFDTSGGLLAVAIGEGGSVLHRETGPAFVISAAITRDWRVSPAGDQLAFIETDLATGLEFRFALISLVDGAPVTAQQSSGQQLGVAWRSDGTLAVGQDPGSGQSRDQSAGGVGFDVPLDYSPDGAYLAVEAWSGSSFESPGAAALHAVSSSGRTPLASGNRFAGWVVR